MILINNPRTKFLDHVFIDASKSLLYRKNWNIFNTQNISDLFCAMKVCLKKRIPVSLKAFMALNTITTQNWDKGTSEDNVLFTRPLE